LKEVQQGRRETVKRKKWLMTRKQTKKMEQRKGSSQVTTQENKGRNT
jgi:hypothetical protein